MASRCAAPWIAVVAPFSTEEAIVAGPLLDAVLGLVTESGADIDVIGLDDRRDPARAAELVASKLGRGGCAGLIGPKNSGCALAVAPIARGSGVPMLLPCATADELTAADGVVFRLCAPDRATAAAAVALAAELGAGRLAVLADDTAYGQGLAAKVRAAAEAGGVAVTEDPRGTTTAFLAMGEVEQATLIRSLRAGGYRGELISAEGGPQAPIAKLAGEEAEGTWLLYPGTPVAGRTVYAAEAADAARILLTVAGGGADAIRAGTFEGETGQIRFARDGEREGVTVSRYRVVDGSVQLSTS